LARSALARVERVVQARKASEAVVEDAVVGRIARVRPVKQRHVPGLAHEDAEADHAQVGPLALRVPSPRQFARRLRRDVRVEVRRVEREDVCAKLKSRDHRACQLELRILELTFVRRHRKPMEYLAGEGLRR